MHGRLDLILQIFHTGPTNVALIAEQERIFMSTTFESLGAVVDNAIECHHLSAPLYESLQEKTTDPRHKKLLQQMSHNETHMADLLKRMKSQVEDGVLDTRLQFTREQEPAAFIESITPVDDELDIEQIGRLGEQLHGYLVDLLEGAQQETLSEPAGEMVRDILQLEKAEGQSFSRKANAAYEM